MKTLNKFHFSGSANPAQKTPQTEPKPLKFSPNGDTSHTINNNKKKKKRHYRVRVATQQPILNHPSHSKFTVTNHRWSGQPTHRPTGRPSRFSEEFSDAHKETRRHFFILLSSSQLHCARFLFSPYSWLPFFASHRESAFLVQVINFT